MEPLVLSHRWAYSLYTFVFLHVQVHTQAQMPPSDEFHSLLANRQNVLTSYGHCTELTFYLINDKMEYIVTYEVSTFQFSWSI
jgi:hypothetical protein